MKTKRFFLRFILIFTVGANMYFVFKANSEEIEKLPLLTDLEVLADDGKFVRGPRGTNWEEYTTDCTYTKTSGTSVTIGIPGTGSPLQKKCQSQPMRLYHLPLMLLLPMQ